MKEVKKEVKKTKTVAVEDLISDVILYFCENAAELGCPRSAEHVDMWFRELGVKERFKVSSKLLDIMERDCKKYKK